MVLSRRGSDDSLEVAIQVTLVDKAGAYRDDSRGSSGPQE
jgi:hypothetical protein